MGYARIAAVLIVPLLLVTAAGCQTIKPKAPEESFIRTESSGFSPRAQKGREIIDFSLFFGNAAAVSSWRVEISGPGGLQKSFQGDAANLPSTLSWDGAADAGSEAPEGAYSAVLSIDYGNAFTPCSTRSSEFILDTTPPAGRISLSPPAFTPAEAGVAAPMTITLKASQPVARIDSWSLEVLDPDGRLFKGFDGKGSPGKIAWDGMGMTGGFVEPATTYSAVATVRDEFGNVGQIRSAIPVRDIPMATENTLVAPKAGGFSPKSASEAWRTIALQVAFGNPSAVKYWKISLAHQSRGIQKTFSGESGALPDAVTWDGRNDAGALAPEGRYSAHLSVDYGMSFKPALVKSRPFVLDIDPPAGIIAVSPNRLVPDGKGGIQPVTFTIFASSQTAAIVDWDMKVLGPDGQVAAGFEGQWPRNSVRWDGRTDAGGSVDPGRKYVVVVNVRDEFVNTGIGRGVIAVGDAPAVQGQVSLAPQAAGFSPNGDTFMDTIGLALSYGQPAAVSSWKVEIVNAKGEPQRRYAGDGARLPPVVSWDGKTETGSRAAEGVYTARLNVSYGKIFAPASVESASFVLDVTPPSGTIALSAPLFSPVDASDTLTISLAPDSPTARIDSWVMDIFDPGGSLFRSFQGRWPSDRVAWDGKNAAGEMVESAEEYPVAVRVRDELGNTGTITGIIPVDILVEKTPTGYLIRSSRIFFKAFTADYRDVHPELSTQNFARLNALAEKLAKFPGYRFLIVGHAVMINWASPARGRIEQEQVLIPLSKARAQAVKQAMVDRGLDPDAFAIDGVGASDPLVPDSDYAQRWRNRRVAFFIEKK